MALQQAVCNDSTAPLVGDIIAMSGQHMGAVKAQATSAIINVLGAWVIAPQPGYPGTYDNDIVEVNCTSQPTPGTPLFLSDTVAGKAQTTAPTNSYFIGTCLASRTVGSTYKATVNFDKGCASEVSGVPLTTKQNITATPSANDIPLADAFGTLNAWITPASSIGPTSSAINTVETYLNPQFKLNANTLVAGNSYRITVTGTNTSTVANLSTFTVRMGTAGTTADTSLGTVTATSATTGTNIPFSVSCVVTVQSIGSNGSVIFSGSLTNSGTTGINTTQTPVMVLGSPTAGMNTTGALYLGITYKSAASTTTSTFQQVIVEHIR
jgi:hypothetical protein